MGAFLSLNAPTAHSREPAQLYVSPQGSYVGGCTPKFPCNDIKRAISFSIPGDVIVLKDGTYPGFTLANIPGTAERPLTIQAEHAHKAIITPTSDRRDNRDNIYITHSDWIVIDGLSSSNAPRAGIRVDNSHHVTVKNGVFGPNGVWGIFTNHSHDVHIENNIVFGSQEQHGIYVSNSADRPLIQGNKVYDNNMCGIHLNGDLSAGGGRDVSEDDGVITDVVIQDNTIFNNGHQGGAGINMDGIHDALILNNLLYNNHSAGIAAFLIDGGAGPKNIKIYHNIFDMAPDARATIIIKEAIGPIMLMNNIIYTRNAKQGALSIGNKSDRPHFLKYVGIIGSNLDLQQLHSNYNIFSGSPHIATLNNNVSRYNLKEWQYTKNDAHSLWVAPEELFKDITAHDYTLQKSSPARQRGILLKEINNAVKGQRPNIGTYQ